VEDAARAIETLFESRIAWEGASRRCLDHFEREHSSAEVFTRYARLFAELAG
jgi:hypothetical protein